MNNDTKHMTRRMSHSATSLPTSIECDESASLYLASCILLAHPDCLSNSLSPAYTRWDMALAETYDIPSGSVTM